MNQQNEKGFVTIYMTPETTIQLVRDIAENRIKFDPTRPRHSVYKKEKKRIVPIVKAFSSRTADAQLIGRKLVHFVTGQEIEIMDRNIWDKYIAKWPDGSLTTISPAELIHGFSETNSVSLRN